MYSQLEKLEGNQQFSFGSAEDYQTLIMRFIIEKVYIVLKKKRIKNNIHLKNRNYYNFNKEKSKQDHLIRIRYLKRMIKKL